MLISHDVSIIAELCDRVAVMYAGKIVEYADSTDLFLNPVHPYAKGLFSAFPDIRRKKMKLNSIAGSPPNLLNPPAGCRFHPRCQSGKERCMVDEPELGKIEPHHYVACWRD